ncbi:MAG: MotA/TolQ/ExbB proton channel family protein, partial [Cyanobacteria bacterium P01_D01_bin.73]
MSNWFTDGGIVMYPLVGCGLLTVALIGERSRFWWRLLQRQIPFTREVLLQYRQDPIGVGAKLRQAQDLPIARIFWAALSLDRPTPQEFRFALEAAAQGEIQNLRRYQTAFDTVVSLAPLLGLLGT